MTAWMRRAPDVFTVTEAAALYDVLKQREHNRKSGPPHRRDAARTPPACEPTHATRGPAGPLRASRRGRTQRKNQRRGCRSAGGVGPIDARNARTVRPNFSFRVNVARRVAPKGRGDPSRWGSTNSTWISPCRQPMAAARRGAPIAPRRAAWERACAARALWAGFRDATADRARRGSARVRDIPLARGRRVADGRRRHTAVSEPRCGMRGRVTLASRSAASSRRARGAE